MGKTEGRTNPEEILYYKWKECDLQVQDLNPRQQNLYKLKQTIETKQMRQWSKLPKVLLSDPPGSFPVWQPLQRWLVKEGGLAWKLRMGLPRRVEWKSSRQMSDLDLGEGIWFLTPFSSSDADLVDHRGHREIEKSGTWRRKPKRELTEFNPNSEEWYDNRGQ